MANPTTNYGFVLPTSSDLVTDLPADFDVALQGVDTRLKALQPGTTLGDLAYSSATANTNTRLGIGSTGQVLTVSGGVPAWSTPAGGGKVKQIVNATTTTETTIASTTYTDTTITATITPTASTSQILVLISTPIKTNRSAESSYAIGAKLLRGATALFTNGAILGFDSVGSGAGAVSMTGNYSVNYLDSPATTSATTYKLQGRISNTANSSNAVYQYDFQTATITLMEIGA